ncbi:MAG TPA: galactokinase [Cyclobacteriaceae bacterium]|nr:galactokinase [Cyclobacteriaceae bacterium]
MKNTDNIKAIFAQKFKGTPTVFVAPGRINLIGEHTDYNEGFVMPAAIDHHITFAIALNNTETFNFFAIDYNEGASFDLPGLKPGDGWVNYLMGVVDGIRKKGLPVKGVDCVFGSTIPVGAGLSSSAALGSGLGFAINELQKFSLSRLDLAKNAQYSEHKFAGVRCGIMDMYASLFGQKNSALLLDCKNLTHEVLPVSLGEYCIMLIDTKVKHSLASTAYNDRRASCEEGVRIIQKTSPHVQSLRDVTRLMLDEHQDQMGEEVYIKCGFVVDEIARTRKAAGYLKSGQIELFGALLYETHTGLSRHYDVSCEELDFLVDLAAEQRDSFLGARMMGGGFGGCTINLVRKSRVDFVRGYVHDKYFTTFKKEPDFYLVTLAEGVHREGPLET